MRAFLVGGLLLSLVGCSDEETRLAVPIDGGAWSRRSAFGAFKPTDTPVSSGAGTTVAPSGPLCLPTRRRR